MNIRLHAIERDHDGWTVRIAVPSYDLHDPRRDVGAGWFQGEPCGMLIRGRVDDLREVARVLVEAADQIDKGAEPNRSYDDVRKVIG